MFVSCLPEFLNLLVYNKSLSKALCATHCQNPDSLHHLTALIVLLGLLVEHLACHAKV